MSAKVARDTLRQYRAIKARIKVIDLMVLLQETDDGIKGIAFDGIVISPTNVFTSVVENQVLRSLMRRDALMEERRTLSCVLGQVDAAIESLRKEEQLIVRLYYINEERLLWTQIARAVGFSESHILNKIHPRILAKIGYALQGRGKSNVI